MANRRYPRLGCTNIKSRTRHDGQGVCAQCGEKIAVGSAYVVADIQYSQFRGDDDVATLCRPCEKNPQLWTIIRFLERQAN